MQKSCTRLFLLLIVLFSHISLMSQNQTDYAERWKEVDRLLLQERLPETARVKVMNIYRQAKTDGRDADQVRALLYLGLIRQEKEEQADSLSIRSLEEDLKTASPLGAALIHSLIADYYWYYVQQHRFELYERTATTGLDSNDFHNWSLPQFHEVIRFHFLRSLEPVALLQTTPTARIESMVVRGNRPALRPTAYDLLVQKALFYFMNLERGIHEPGRLFETDDLQVLAPANVYVQTKFENIDSAFGEAIAIRLFQDWLRFHQRDENPEVLLDIDLQRLTYMHRLLEHENKNDAYIKTLVSIRDSYPRQAATAKAVYQLLQLQLPGIADLATAGERKKEFERVLQEADQSIKQFPQSEGAELLQLLRAQVLGRQLSTRAEQVNTAGQDLRVLVNYRNIPRVYYRLVSLDAEDLNRFPNLYVADWWKYVLSRSALRNGQVNLPGSEDYTDHRAEVRVEALPAGLYAWILSEDPGFRVSNNHLSMQILQVSNLAWILRGEDLFVMDRVTGAPVADAKVNLLKESWDYKAERKKQSLEGSLTTNVNGYAKINGSGNFIVEVVKGKDRFRPLDAIYLHSVSPSDEKKELRKPRIFYFTDRGLYRPAQPVYVKGIVVDVNDTRNPVVVKDYETTLVLREVNGQPVDTVSVRTNEFGSFHAEFRLPAAGLTGQFLIEDEAGLGSMGIQVEEYKRPRFEVKLQAPAQLVRLKDSVKVSGQAMSYAGASVSQARVRYRVIRRNRWMPYWWGARSLPVQEEQIAQGVTEANAQGQFDIQFVGKPARSVSAIRDQSFTFVVMADVTDASGETRSQELAINIGDRSLQVSTTSVKPMMESESLRQIKVNVQTQQDSAYAAPAALRIWRLQSPQRWIRDRYWETPDQFTMTEQEYTRYFPYDEYHTEKDPSTWKRGQQVFSQQASGKSTYDFSIGQPLQAGWYLVEVESITPEGDTARNSYYTCVADSRRGLLPMPQLVWNNDLPQTLEPGATFTWKGLQMLGQLHLIRCVESSDRDDYSSSHHRYEFARWIKGQARWELPVADSLRGGFRVEQVFVWQNRVFETGQLVQVPWSNKELDVTVKTFRDKSLPGSRETWSVSVRGKQGDRVMAELLTSMYDESLDQFLPFQWNKPGLFPSFTGGESWNTRISFGRREGQGWAPDTYPQVRIEETKYDQLLGLIAPPDGPELIPVLLNRAYGVGIRRRGQPVQDMVVESAMAPAAAKNEEFAEGKGGDPSIDRQPGKTGQVPQAGRIRKDFRETAFWFPQLRTDAEGHITFEFTVPDALTRWKWQMLAHTPDMKSGLATQTFISQKELMVEANATRFLREGDQVFLAARISNLSAREFSGKAELQLVDPETGQPVDGFFRNIFPVQYFTAEAGSQTVVRFPIEAPFGYTKPLVYRIVASAGNFQDAEENILPVLTSRVFITETQPLWMTGNRTSTFTFESFRRNNSPSLSHHAMTVEWVSNPAWYAVLALPYLAAEKDELLHSLLNRYYANSLSAGILRQKPELARILREWKQTDSASMKSPLERNEDLKNILLKETPWVMDALAESRQQQQLVELFDAARIRKELAEAFTRIKALQTNNGGFTWYPGGREDQYLTTEVLRLTGRLRQLRMLDDEQWENWKPVIRAATDYLDRQLRRDYEEEVKRSKKTSAILPRYSHIRYLYARSFYRDITLAPANRKAYDYYLGDIRTGWNQLSIHEQAQVALILHRHAQSPVPAAILKSLLERATRDNEKGMYWKQLSNRYSGSALATHALVMEALMEIKRDNRNMELLKRWLIVNRQTNRWENSISTADAVYSFLLQGEDWLKATPVLEFQWGDQTFSFRGQTGLAALGYGRLRLPASSIRDNLATLRVTSSGLAAEQPAWISMYWQYFERMDAVKKASTPVRLQRQLMKKVNTDKGPELKLIAEGESIVPGDEVVARITITTDRDMDYVHLRDLRAAGMEPRDMISGYRWQNGLGYYLSVKDIGADLFIQSLPKGTHVLEIPLVASHSGQFSSGLGQLQCLYAPAFSAQSEGGRLRVLESQD